MDSEYNEVLKQIKRLPLKDRLSLAREILTEAPDDDQDWLAVEKAWAEETERRVAMLESGEMELMDWEVAREILWRNQRDQVQRHGCRTD